LNHAEIRDLLNKEKTRLEESLSRQDVSLKGDFEKGQRFSQEEMSIINHKATREKIKDIVAALSRLDDGTYSICTSCGKPIEPDRLNAYPEVGTCITCASKRPKNIWGK